MSFLLPTWTLCRRDLIRFWREKARVAAYAASPIFFWFVIGSGFGDLGVFFPGALTMTVLFAAIFSTMSIIEDRNEGFLLSMLVLCSPASPRFPGGPSVAGLRQFQCVSVAQTPAWDASSTDWWRKAPPTQGRGE